MEEQGIHPQGANGSVYEMASVHFHGGFGHNYTSTSLLAQYRTHLMHMPTTNGEHFTDVGIKMGEEIGAKTVDLEWVQEHTTGLVKQDGPDTKIMLLGAEAFRDVGGIVFDANGKGVRQRAWEPRLRHRRDVEDRATIQSGSEQASIGRDHRAVQALHWSCSHEILCNGCGPCEGYVGSRLQRLNRNTELTIRQR